MNIHNPLQRGPFSSPDRGFQSGRPGARAIAALLLLAAMLTGCGGGGGTSDLPQNQSQTESADSGDLAISITDAPGDFVTYLVDVTSIKLQRSNGDVVEALPLTTRIDFTQLTEVSEFLTVATVPAGNYEAVTVTLDFSDAQVMVQDNSGDPIAADLQDVHGNPLSTLDARLELAGDQAIRITRATTRAFSLDFDLDASNSIDTTTLPPVVTVEPLLLAMPELEQDREHRLRGVLADVNDASMEVTLKVRPFHHRSGSFGRFTFDVNDATVYQIDGETFTGDPGLTVLAAMSENTAVAAHGDAVDGALLANHVVAGTSVYWSDTDVVHGVVAARNSDTLTLRGVAVERQDAPVRFRGELTVNLSNDTVVTAPAIDSGDLDHQSISVGQRIIATGELVDDQTFDATQGRVRMLFNRLWGDVVQVDPLIVDLHLINGRQPGIFDFTGTGVTSAQDAIPEAYDIDTASLGLLDLDVDDLVQVRGLVNRFGFAPPDFLARTVTDVAADARAATAKVAWPEGSSLPFLTVAPDRLDLDLNDARAVVKLKGRTSDSPLEPDTLALVAPDSGRGIYAVAERAPATGDRPGGLTLYRAFADLTDALTAKLDAGALLHRTTAHGRYTETSDELKTVRAIFVFSSAAPVENAVDGMAEE